MSKQVFSNNAATTLYGTVPQGGTTLVLSQGTGNYFPAPTNGDYFLGTLYEKDASGNDINIEVIKCTARVADTLTIERDFEGLVGVTGGLGYPSAVGKTVYFDLRWTAGSAENMAQRVANLSDLPDAAAARSNLGLGEVNNTSDTAKPVSTAQATAIALKLDATHAGTGGTSHAVATTAVAGFLSGADKTKLDSVSGSNTGDETNATIKTKLGITTLSGVNTGDQTATTTPNTPAGNIVATTVQSAINELDTEKQPRDANLVSVAPGAFGDVLVWDGSKWAAQASPEDAYAFSKADSTTPAFTKTSASTLSVKAGSSAKVSGVKVSWPVATAVTMPALTGGTNYAIYVCADGSLRADSNWSAPAGYTTANSRKIGGFHFGLVAPGTTVAGGSFNAAGSPTTGGMVWTQADVDKIAGINEFSLWDLKFRPACADPRGMVLVNGRTWVDIYLCSTDTAANGTSKAGSNIASGTVLPKVPSAFGGNGALAYTTLDWWVANELARANQKRLMLASEFYDAAFGVTENQSIDATASTYPVTQRNAGYTSRYGIEQAAGVHYTWGQDSAGSSAAWTANGGRGQSYNSAVFRVVLGGARTDGSNSGSRCSVWVSVSSYSDWNLGLRAASDHLQLL